MTALLAAEAATCRVGKAQILSETTLQFDAGEFAAVVGPNGAGKTTLLRVLAGDEKPTTGAVTIEGTPLTEFAPNELARHRALLDQDGVPNVPFPASAVVALGRAPHRRAEGNSSARDAQIVARVMKHLGVDHLAGRVYSTLSGGERCLVSLARALAQATQITLLDEPTAALDVAVEERTMSLLQRHASDGHCVVAVVHDLNLASRHADRIVVMSGGAVVADGPPEEVFTSGLLSRVYGHSMEVVDHPLRDGPLILVR